MATLPFTKTLYSQIVSQQFYAPKLFRMPPPSAPEFKAHELGMKLACGFEMLMNDQHLRDLSSNATAEKTVETYHFEADRNWKSFVERLRTLGYFRNELEGSKLYKDLERRAKEEYLSQQSSQTSSDADNIPSVNPIDRINALLSEFQRHNDLTDNEFLSTVVPTLSGPEDSEAWMIVEPEDLDRMLAAQFGELAMRDGDDGGLIFDDEEEYEDDEVFDDDEGESNLEKANSRQKDKLKELDKMVRGLNTFVEKESGVGGAILPHERYVDPEESDDDDQKPSKAAGSTAPISFDFDKFLRIMGVPNTKAGIQQPKEQNEYEPGEDSGEDEEEFRIYMEAMDRELSATKIGRDFASAATASTSEPSSTAPSTTATTEKAKETIVSGTEVGRAVSVEEKVELEEQEESDSRLRPVDINVNLVKNLLESFAAQEGLPGPASNLLGALGVRLPRLGDEKDDEDDEQ
ncbi:hypothetical protein HK102_013475 [Quaeritorhiza haematococci]|nr:hypothetical protein HK102_013475 [Quaeritorhiza haematococci]